MENDRENTHPKTAAKVFKQLCLCIKWSGSFHGDLKFKDIN